MSNDHDARGSRPTGKPPTDLSHLHPDRLRLGSIGVFAGDWAWTGNPPRIPVGFVGTLIDRWNGWAVFRCTREVAEAIVADQDRLREAEWVRLRRTNAIYAIADLLTVAFRRQPSVHDRAQRHITRKPAKRWYARVWWQLDILGSRRRGRVDQSVPPLWFDGDELICDETAIHGEGAVDRHSPGEDGRYCVQGFNWCWQAVDPADCDRIAGVLPAPGESQEFVYATHEPLRMPHDRLTVASIDYLLLTQTGVAFTATLHLDNEPVGTIENPGLSGATEFGPTTATFGRAQMEQFVAGCRWRDQPTSEALVLESLVDFTDRSELHLHSGLRLYVPYMSTTKPRRGNVGAF